MKLWLLIWCQCFLSSPYPSSAGYSFKLDPFLTVVQKQLCWHDAKVGMSGSTHTAETGTGAAEILVEPQPWLPNLPPLLTEVRGQVCGIGGIFQNENIVYKSNPLILNQKLL